MNGGRIAYSQDELLFVAARLPYCTPSAKAERELIAGVLTNLADFAQRCADRAAAEPRLGARAFPQGDT